MRKIFRTVFNVFRVMVIVLFFVLLSASRPASTEEAGNNLLGVVIGVMAISILALGEDSRKEGNRERREIND